MKEKWTLKIRISVAVVAAALVLAGCSAGTSPTSGWSGDAVTGAPAAPECRGDADDPQPGDVICFSGELDEPLEITVSGTTDAPIVYSGGGSATVPGIDVSADNVVVQGFISSGAESTGIRASGENVTVQDNKITQVKLRRRRRRRDPVLRRTAPRSCATTVLRPRGEPQIEDSHVDCMQTFATSGPGSENVVIQGNRCEDIRAQCLMAEGPNDEGGSGEGVSAQLALRGQLLRREREGAVGRARGHPERDDPRATRWSARATKAFALGKGSTGIVVQDNEIGPDYNREVGFDDPSAQEGYNGPEAY